MSWIKQEEQPYPWGPRDSMDGELGLDSGPVVLGCRFVPWQTVSQQAKTWAGRRLKDAAAGPEAE